MPGEGSRWAHFGFSPHLPTLAAWTCLQLDLPLVQVVGVCPPEWKDVHSTTLGNTDGPSGWFPYTCFWFKA